MAVDQSSLIYGSSPVQTGTGAKSWSFDPGTDPDFILIWWFGHINYPSPLGTKPVYWGGVELTKRSTRQLSTWPVVYSFALLNEEAVGGAKNVTWTSEYTGSTGALAIAGKSENGGVLEATYPGSQSDGNTRPTLNVDSAADLTTLLLHATCKHASGPTSFTANTSELTARAHDGYEQVLMKETLAQAGARELGFLTPYINHTNDGVLIKELASARNRSQSIVVA